MKRQNTPHIASAHPPFVSGFTDIERETSKFTIGESDIFEDLFGIEMPEYITALCKLSVKSNFPDVIISAGYRTDPGGSDLIMQKKLYDGSEISKKGLISEISIELIDLQTESLKNQIPKNSVIFTKRFQIQPVSRRIPNYPDNSEKQSGIFMTKSEAYPFAGLYFEGMKLSDIQPQLFYVGTDFRAKPYIKAIPAKEALQNDNIKICKDISIESLTSLEDDIYTGKAKIKLNDTEYESITSKKNTLISDIFTITFKKI